jgi:hypothetical protein
VLSTEIQNLNPCTFVEFYVDRAEIPILSGGKTCLYKPGPLGILNPGTGGPFRKEEFRTGSKETSFPLANRHTAVIQRYPAFALVV